MILILSDAADETTCSVINWINRLKPLEEVIRINYTDKITALTISNNSIIVTFRRWNNVQLEIDFNTITAYWYRRGRLDFDKFFSEQFLKKQLYDYEQTELKRIAEYLHHCLRKIKCLNSFLNVAPNKLVVNHIAEECGLTTPSYIISSKKNELSKFTTKENFVITKGIDESICIETEENVLHGYTEKLTIDDLAEYDDDVFPSLLQKQVEKKYELRIFYLDGSFYSMAIFSQRDEQTQIDFRKYNFRTPNRCVPYTLPHAIESKLKLLMDKLELNSGSIDMIVDLNNEYVFLEVNPIGQFGMVSEPCNYFLEKKVAEFLIN
jgi:ATP-GRASP peptide maturase of grasp-with-spasm system